MLNVKIKSKEDILDLFSDIVLPKNAEKVLVFSPHPDDETIGAGGFIFESVTSGADVRIVLVTDGNKHNMKEKRYGEFVKAATILGVKRENLEFLDFEDGHLKSEPNENLSEKISEVLNNFRPDYVVYPHPADKHPDRRIVGQIVEGLLKKIPPKRAYSYIVHKKTIPGPERLYPILNPNRCLFPPKSLLKQGKWGKLILTEEALERKTKAVFVYKTQLRFIFLKELLYSFIGKNEIYRERRVK